MASAALRRIKEAEPKRGNLKVENHKVP